MYAIELAQDESEQVTEIRQSIIIKKKLKTKHQYLNKERQSTMQVVFLSNLLRKKERER